MNINKLVEMAREKNPNQQLAKLSMQWTEQKNNGNPVRNAVSLWRWRWFTGVNITLFLLWLTITIVWKPHTPSIGNGLSVWRWIAIIIVFPQFVSFMSAWESGTYDTYDDVKKFIRAISVLESVIGKPLDKWTDADDLQGRACTYLKEMASSVKTAEKTEKEEIERTPWVTPSLDKRADPKRKLFEFHFDLLTTVLPLSKDRGTYYGNKVSATTEISATS